MRVNKIYLHTACDICDEEVKEIFEIEDSYQGVCVSCLEKLYVNLRKFFDPKINILT